MDRAHIPQVTYPSNVWALYRSVRRQPGAPGLSVQVLNVNRHRSNHMACNHPRKEPSPIHRPKPINTSCVRYAYVRGPTRVQLPALQPPTRGSLWGEGAAFLTKLGDPTKDTPLESIWHLPQVRRLSHQPQQVLEWVRSSIPRDHAPAF